LLSILGALANLGDLEVVGKEGNICLICNEDEDKAKAEAENGFMAAVLSSSLPQLCKIKFQMLIVSATRLISFLERHSQLEEVEIF
jgi:hypothetical protein